MIASLQVLLSLPPAVDLDLVDSAWTELDNSTSSLMVRLKLPPGVAEGPHLPSEPSTTHPLAKRKVDIHAISTWNLHFCPPSKLRWDVLSGVIHEIFFPPDG